MFQKEVLNEFHASSQERYIWLISTALIIYLDICGQCLRLNYTHIEILSFILMQSLIDIQKHNEYIS